MARNGYGRDYGRREGPGRGDDRHSYGMRGYEMGPGWGWDDDGSDPNWRGGTYHGLRMQGGSHQAAYGRERFYHQADLGGAGGFDGRYDLPNGFYDGNGYYHEQWEDQARGAGPARWLGHPRYDRDLHRVEDGGVRYDQEYLRQYNAQSPALRHGGPRRSWGFSEGPNAPPMHGRHDARDRPTGERGYSGYNTGGFADNGLPGPGTRGSLPTQKGGR
ncbi:MAG TPA: hypothetical protein VFJ16_00915 [Longimicrobium sp.]|nr:hypothetical protein [Longimicrobium sp.]